MITRFKQPIWIFPLAIAGLVALFGWWGNARLRETIQAQLKAELATTLTANVTTLDIWTTNQGKLVTSLADEPEVRALALKIIDESGRSRNENRGPEGPESELAGLLRPRLNKIGYGMAHLVSTNFVIVADSRSGRMPGGMLVHEDHTNKFSELFASGEPIIITPFKPKPPPERPPRPNRPRGPPGDGRGTNNFPRGDRPPPPDGPRPPRRGYVTMMQVAAPIRDDQGHVRGALALIINPDAEFSRILSAARSGQSGETYAFDQNGLMISKSRFDQQLKQLGLIDPQPSSTSALSLRLAEPPANLPKKFSSEDTNSTSQPLIALVANGVNGGSGTNITPSIDYRGVPVVGAWRWLPQHEFGVVTQIDAAEAYEPLRVLKLLFLVLFLLLVISAMSMFLFSYVNVISRRKLTEAELKLRQLGQYQLEEKIGEGGMGVVYRARHALMRRETAVKLLLPDRADPASIQRFEREVCLTCQLTHPNTIQVYDYGRTPEGIFYYAMELLHGLNLHQLIARYGAQSESRVIHILSQICDSLDEAHNLGLVHRDIKPANIFLCQRGGVADCVKVLDFGLVREFRGVSSDDMHLTADKDLVGTPSFMAPEAIRNSNKSDPRSDIYAIGALGYFILTGQNVFDADSVVDLYNKQMSTTPAPPSEKSGGEISVELETTLLRCLEKDPALRPSSVLELRSLLLMSPRADDWTSADRSAWWADYNGRIESERVVAAAIDTIPATVKIDIDNRKP